MRQHGKSRSSRVRDELRAIRERCARYPVLDHRNADMMSQIKGNDWLADLAPRTERPQQHRTSSQRGPGPNPALKSSADTWIIASSRAAASRSSSTSNCASQFQCAPDEGNAHPTRTSNQNIAPAQPDRPRPVTRAIRTSCTSGLAHASVGPEKFRLAWPLDRTSTRVKPSQLPDCFPQYKPNIQQALTGN